VLVINKIDLATAEDVQALSVRLSAANPIAEQHQVRQGAVSAAVVLGRGLFRGARLGTGADAGRPRFRRAHVHDPFGSVVLRDAGPHDLRRLRGWLLRLVGCRPYDFYRYKGVVNRGGRRARVALQGVHSLFQFEALRSWAPDETPETTLVMIGVDLAHDELLAGLQACRKRAAPTAAVGAMP
jgi:G3E family GTPase